MTGLRLPAAPVVAAGDPVAGRGVRLAGCISALSTARLVDPSILYPAELRADKSAILVGHVKDPFRSTQRLGEAALLGLSALPVGLADQDRGPRIAVRDGFNEQCGEASKSHGTSG